MKMTAYGLNIINMRYKVIPWWVFKMFLTMAIIASLAMIVFVMASKNGLQVPEWAWNLSISLSVAGWIVFFSLWGLTEESKWPN